MLREYRLDLAELDPEAAQLHLVVEPAQELECRRRAPAQPGHRSGTGGPGCGEKGSATNRSAVSSGRSR